MRLRAAQLACLLLLLSTFGATPDIRSSEFALSLGPGQVHTLLARDRAAAPDDASLRAPRNRRSTLAAGAVAAALIRAPRTMRPGAAQAVALFAHTAYAHAAAA